MAIVTNRGPRRKRLKDVTAAQGEASYQAIRLVSEHPRLRNLLFKAQDQGADWVTLLNMLQQAIAERPND